MGEEKKKKRQIIPTFVPLSASRSSLHLFPLPSPSHLVPPPHSDLSSPHLVHAAEASADVCDGSGVGNDIKVSPLVCAEVNGGVRVTARALTPRSNLIRWLQPQPEPKPNLIIST